MTTRTLESLSSADVDRLIQVKQSEVIGLQHARRRGEDSSRERSHSRLSREEDNRLPPFATDSAKPSGLAGVVKSLQERVDWLQAENLRLQSEIGQLARDRDAANTEKSRMQNQTQELTMINEQLRGEVEQLRGARNQVLTAEQVQNTLMRDLEDKSVENNQLRENLARLRDDKNMLRQECEEWEHKCHKISEGLKRLERRASEEIHEAREHAQRSTQTVRELELRLKKTEDQLAKEREQADKRLRIETERMIDTANRAEEKVALLKEELRAAHADLAILRKNQQFLERRTAKQERGNADEESLKVETKKLLALAVELTSDMLNTAKGDKALQAIHKAYVHRQMALEKKYQKLRADLLNKAAGSTTSRLEKPLLGKVGERRSNAERSMSGGSRARGIPRQDSARSIASRGSRVSHRSQTSNTSKGSARKSSGASKQKKGIPESPSRLRSTEKLASSGKKRLGSTQKELLNSTQDSGRRAGSRQRTAESTILLGRNDDSKMTDVGARDSSIWGSTSSNLGPLQSSPASPMTREGLKAEIHTLEDNILGLKKQYKQQVAHGFARTETKTVAISNEIERLSDRLLALRRQLRLMDQSSKALLA